MVRCESLAVCKENIQGNGALPEPKPGGRAVVVIPVYKTRMSRAEELSFMQCLRVLARHDIVLMAPERLDVGEYVRVAGHDVRVERFTDLFFKDIEGYNALLVSAHFYWRFAAYDYMLIYQLDAWVLSDQLQLWCDKGYDYIGAPWFQEFLSHEHGAKLWRSGNGGFSLRKIRKFIQATESGLPRKIFEKKAYWEDRCFTVGLDDTAYRMSSPTALEAAEFALERSPAYLHGLTGKLPFGCHAWEANGLTSFWRRHIPYLPDRPTGTRLSIVTINYNNLQGLKRTADSVLGQSWHDYEWIVIDGGSDDGSVEFLKELSPCITYWCSERDRGVYDAQNKGIAHCRGTYVNFMNAGDMFMNHTVLNDTMNPYPMADVIYSDWMDIRKDGPVMRVPPERIARDFFDYNWCNLCHQSLIVRTALLKERGYDTSYRIYADWVRWRELAHAGCTFAKAEVSICAYDAREGLSNAQNEQQQQEYASLQLKDEVPTKVTPTRDFHLSLGYRLKDRLCQKLRYVHIDPRDIPVCPRELQDADNLPDESSANAKTLSWRGENLCVRCKGRTAIFALEMLNGHIYYRERFLIAMMQEVVDSLVIVGDCPIEPAELGWLKANAVAIDFGHHRSGALESYRRGLNHVVEMGLVDDNDQLLLFHSSCYGPVYPLQDALAAMEPRGLDFWGMTSTCQDGIKFVQPYFYGIRGELVKSGDVLRALHPLATPVSFTKELSRGGRYWNTYVPYGAIAGDPMRHPLTLVRDFHCPFIGRRNLCGECEESIFDTIRYVNKVNYSVAAMLNVRFYKR